MLLYRVSPYLPHARRGEPGHPLYKPPQGSGRWDNPGRYTAWYLGATPEAVIGESFAHHLRWTDDMFVSPATPGSRRALCTFQLDERLDLLDLDDAHTLMTHGMRPTQVVIRNRSYTQSRALGFYQETDADGTRRWHGIRWWSLHRPKWSLVVLWDDVDAPAAHDLVDVAPLGLRHPAVVDAAETLAKELVDS